MKDFELIIDDIHHGIWTSRDGTRRYIVEMTNEHLINCLNTFSEDTQRGKALRDYMKKVCPTLKFVYE